MAVLVGRRRTPNQLPQQMAAAMLVSLESKVLTAAATAELPHSAGRRRLYRAFDFDLEKPACAVLSEESGLWRSLRIY